MRMLSRYVVLVIAGTLLIPSVAAAHTDESTPQPSKSPQVKEQSRAGSGHLVKGERVEPGQFCGRFADINGTVKDDTAKNFSQLAANFAGRGDKVNQSFTDLNTRVMASRTAADAQLAKQLAGLEAKAVTGAQKTAVATFGASVKAAATTRRTAVDAANAAFKQALLADLTNRQAKLKAAATTYQTAVATALAQAKTSCAAGTGASAVRTTLKAALQAAKTKLEAARTVNKTAGLDALKATRQAAIEQANATFKATFKLALADLKSALRTP